jgi:cellulose synthase/poly-beta-1,6-N-acetylglucosamine synthase-like glycosyltransferase
VAQASLPKVSIIVASMNNQDTIEECLQALLDQDYPREFIEIIVMDGCSRDKTVELAQKYPVKVLSMRLNAPAAYNYALKIASHPILGFVDSDAKVEKDWLKKLVPNLNEAKVAGVSGSIDTWNMDNPWGRSIGYELKNRYSRIKKYTGRIATMNLLLKRSVIEEVGDWDEKLPSQYDTDFGYRLSAKGYKIAYEPSATCYHFNRPTVKAYYKQQRQYGKNTIKLYFKHTRLVAGDEITDFGMNIQPALVIAVLGSFLLGILPLLRAFWYLTGLLLVAMLAYYLYSAVKVTLKYHDKVAMRLVVLYYVRSFAWFVGAAITTLKYVSGQER